MNQTSSCAWRESPSVIWRPDTTASAVFAIGFTTTSNISWGARIRRRARSIPPPSGRGSVAILLTLPSLFAGPWAFRHGFAVPILGAYGLLIFTPTSRRGWGGRWLVYDATRLSPEPGFVRIGMGRDAADTAVATVTGPATFRSLNIEVRLLSPEADFPGYAADPLCQSDGKATLGTLA